MGSYLLVHRMYVSDFHVKHKFPWEEFPLLGKRPIPVPLFGKEGSGEILRSIMDSLVVGIDVNED
jgi:hypothetical protein